MAEAGIHWLRGIAVTLVCFVVVPGIAAVLPILLLSVWDVPEILGGGTLGKIVKGAVLTIGILLFLVLLYQSIGICERAFGRKRPDAGKLVTDIGELRGFLGIAVVYFVAKVFVLGLHAATNWDFLQKESLLEFFLVFGAIGLWNHFQDTWVFVRSSDLEGSVKKTTNLRFEGEAVSGMPDGWSDSQGNVDRVSTLYSFDVESREEGAGEQCVRMHRVNASKEEFGSLMQRWPAHTLAGRAIRIEADIRTEDVDNMAGLWLRIDGDKSMLFFDNMADRPIQGTTPWKTYSLETEVPTKAKWLNYGFLLSGNGTLWAADVRVSASDEQGQYRPV